MADNGKSLMLISLHPKKIFWVLLTVAILGQCHWVVKLFAWKTGEFYLQITSVSFTICNTDAFIKQKVVFLKVDSKEDM